MFIIKWIRYGVWFLLKFRLLLKPISAQPNFLRKPISAHINFCSNQLLFKGPLTQTKEEMSPRPVVAVAGANGKLGVHVIDALMSKSFRPNFGGVVALVRESTPQKTIDEWEKQGVTVRIYNEENMVESLAEVDTLINV